MHSKVLEGLGWSPRFWSYTRLPGLIGSLSFIIYHFIQICRVCWRSWGGLPCALYLLSVIWMTAGSPIPLTPTMFRLVVRQWGDRGDVKDNFICLYRAWM